MKKLFLWAWALPLLAGGCSDSQTEPPGPEPPQPTLALVSDDGRVTITDGGRAALVQIVADSPEDLLFSIETNQGDFSAAAESGGEWITLAPKGSTLSLAFAQNGATLSRDCRIRVTAPARGGGKPIPLKR